MAERKRLLVLGLDSLPPGMTRELADSGDMPFIKELMEKGSFGTLRSVTPANTGSAWNSAWTGLRPHRHGYFGFHHYDFTNDTIHISTSDRLKVPVVWEMLNRHDLKTLVINSPMQFPATELEGVMVSGFMTPSLESACTWPADFAGEIAAKIPDYVFDVRWDRKHNDDATFARNINAVIQAFEQRVEVTRLAMARGPWDVLLVVFKSIDNMLHYTWDYLANRRESPQRTELTLKVFRVLDEACRQLATTAGYPDMNIVVCSDHGHGAVIGHLFLNRFLDQHAYLTRQSRLSRTWSKFVHSCRKRFTSEKKKKKPSAHIADQLNINWAKTRAVMTTSGVIYLNVQGRQPGGTVPPDQYQSLREDIAKLLQNDPFIMKVECPPEATPQVQGDFHVPDILFEPAEGVVARRTVTDGPVWQEGRPDNLQGCHRVEGIILGAGPDLKKGQTLQADLYDIAPTILAACRVPIPQGLDGKPIAAMIQCPFTFEQEPGKTSDKRDRTSIKEVYTKDDEDLISKRLSDLGYL
ncbi:MAG: alkaline phosphatase family protein [Sedimentisphaerales bacterium]|nr:alkaline phosphatase family protein [Sedimentisphaerales bacterium]